VETLAVALEIVKCCWVAKCVKKLFYKILKSILINSTNVRNGFRYIRKMRFCIASIQIWYCFDVRKTNTANIRTKKELNPFDQRLLRSDVIFCDSWVELLWSVCQTIIVGCYFL